MKFIITINLKNGSKREFAAFSFGLSGNSTILHIFLIDHSIEEFLTTHILTINIQTI